MNILKDTVSQLSKEERRVFKIYASRFNGHADRKDIQLFDLYCKDADDETCYQKLYKGKDEKNSFYRLKNRLLEQINKILVMDNVNEIRSVNSHFFLSLYYYFLGKNNFELATYYLRRAEKQAREFEQYELLDLIFGEFIKLSRETLNINPEEFIRLRKENGETLAQIRQLDEVLSVLSYRLKITQNLRSGQNPVLDIYEKTIREFSANTSLSQTPQFRIRVYKAVSQILIQRQDFEHLEPYLTTTYKEFSQDGIFGKNTHDTHIEMLIYLVNTLNSRKRYNDSIPYLEKLYDSLVGFNRLHFSKYIYFYYQAKVASYSKINPDMAIDTLQEMIRSKEIAQNPFYQILAFSNLAFLYFEKGEYHACIKALNRIYINDFYHKLDTSLKVKLAVQELMARFELEDMDTMEYRLEQLKREASHDWSDYPGRELMLIQMIDRMVQNASYSRDPKFKKQVDQFLQKKAANDTELVDYDQWLRKKAKML